MATPEDVLAQLRSLQAEITDLRAGNNSSTTNTAPSVHNISSETMLEEIRALRAEITHMRAANNNDSSTSNTRRVSNTQSTSNTRLVSNIPSVSNPSSTASSSSSSSLTHSQIAGLYKSDAQITQELHRIFKPYGSDSIDEIEKPVTGKFTVKQVILLPLSSIVKPPNGIQLGLIGKLKLKVWTKSLEKNLRNVEEMKISLRKEFPLYAEHLKMYDFDILKKGGTFLEEPNLPNGTVLNGLIASTIFNQRIMYLRPKKDLVIPGSFLRELSEAYPRTKRTRKSINEKDEELDEEVCEKKTKLENENVTDDNVTDENVLDGNVLDENVAHENVLDDFIEDDEYLDDVIEGIRLQEGGENPQHVSESQLVVQNQPVAQEASSSGRRVLRIVRLQEENLPQNSRHPDSRQCFADILQIRELLRTRISDELQKPVVVYRGRVLNSLSLAFRINNFDPEKNLMVKFVDEQENDEAGIDVGGPRKEMMRLAFEEARKSSMFEGPDYAKSLALCNDALRLKHYKTLGILCALSVAYPESPPPNFFSEELFNCVKERRYERHLSISNVQEYDIVKDLESLQNCTTDEELRELAFNSVFLTLCGVTVGSVSLSRKEYIFKDCLYYYLNTRVQPAFQQFLTGLEALGLSNLIGENPCLKEVFVNRGEKITSERMKRLFHVNYSNEEEVRSRQEEVITNFMYLLDDIEGGNCECSLEDVLIFVTACDAIPLGGFQHRPSIKFETNRRNPNPDANTCFNELTLPIQTTDYDEFKAYVCPVFKLCKNLNKA